MGALTSPLIAISGDPNRILNGQFLIDQPFEGTNSPLYNANGTYQLCDGWQLILQNRVTFSCQMLRGFGGVYSLPGGATYYLGFADGIGSAASNVETVKIRQSVEQCLLDVYFYTPTRRNALILQFDVYIFTALKNNKIPVTISVLTEGGVTYNYCTLANIPDVSGQFATCIVGIPLNGLPVPPIITSGLANGIAGMNVDFHLSPGTARNVAAAQTNTWYSAAAFPGLDVAPGGTNLTLNIGNVGQSTQIRNVSLINGNFAPNIYKRAYPQELAACQRYYEKSFAPGVAPAQNAGLSNSLEYIVANAGAVTAGVNVPFKVPKCKAPAMTFYNPGAANANWRNETIGADSAAVTLLRANENNFMPLNAQVAGDLITNACAVHWVADARL